MHNLSITLQKQDEIIIVDDGSTDKTFLALKSKKFPCEHKILRLSRGGIVNALNRGIEISTNEFIARFDVDDRYHADRIDFTLAAFTPEVSAVFTDYQFVDENFDRNLGFMPSPIHHIATELSLLRSQRTAHPSAIFRKEKILQVGGYLEEDFPSEDISLWLRLAKFGQLISVSKVLLFYTLRKGSITSTTKSSAQFKLNEVIEKHLKYGTLKDELASNIESIIDLYTTLPRSEERILFLFYDLIHPKIWSHFSNTEKLKLIVTMTPYFSTFSALSSGHKALFNKIRRDLYRKSLTNS